MKGGIRSQRQGKQHCVRKMDKFGSRDIGHVTIYYHFVDARLKIN